MSDHADAAAEREYESWNRERERPTHAVDRTPYDDLLVEVVLRPDLATKLLEDAAALIRSDYEGTGPDTGGSRWLKDFRELTDHG